MMASAKLAFLGKAGRVKQVGRVAQICLPIKYKEGVISLRVVLMNMWDSTQLHGANYPLTRILFRDWRHCVLFTNSLRSHDTVCLLVQKIRFPGQNSTLWERPVTSHKGICSSDGRIWDHFVGLGWLHPLSYPFPPAAGYTHGSHWTELS